MEITDPVVVEEFSQTIGIPVVEVGGDDGLVQLQFEKSGLFTIEPAPEKRGVHVSLAKSLDYYSAERHGLRALKFSQPDVQRPYPFKVGLMNENCLVLCAFLEDDQFSVQMLFEVLDFMRECMYDLENSS